MGLLHLHYKIYCGKLDILLIVADKLRNQIFVPYL